MGDRFWASTVNPLWGGGPAGAAMLKPGAERIPLLATMSTREKAFHTWETMRLPGYRRA